jgi:hypothetical protein
MSSSEKTIETPKDEPKTPADYRAKKGKNGETELSEKELGQATGGRLDPYK